MLTHLEAKSKVNDKLQRAVFLAEELATVMHEASELAAGKGLISMELFLAVKSGIPSLRNCQVSTAKLIAQSMR